MNTGGTHAPIQDALHRPITAGGFVDGAPTVFTDITKQSGLDKFHLGPEHPKKPPSSMLQVPASPCSTTTTTAGSTSNGSTLEAMKGKEPPPRAMLFHNNRDGPFADVTSKAG